MRMLFAAVLLAASSVFAAAPAAADSPVRLPQLAPGEVLLEVHGLGVVRTPATSAVITTTLYGRGTSEEEARRSLDGEIQRATAAARAAGAAPADIVMRPGPGSSGLTTYDVTEPSPPGGADDAPPPRIHTMESVVVIRLRNAAAARELNTSVAGADEFMGYGGPVYELADDSAPRREARRQAIAASRADAEAYADALGMRIVRMVRVTERAGLDFAALAATERTATSRFGPGSVRRGDDASVETIAVVGVDYVLAPR